jgi:hypothetical protein
MPSRNGFPAAPALLVARDKSCESPGSSWLSLSACSCRRRLKHVLSLGKEVSLESAAKFAGRFHISSVQPAGSSRSASWAWCVSAASQTERNVIAESRMR